ncbi:MAG: response regulator [Bacteroidetes bacterium]|nr:response regulator [Bacteroidota bacterium]MBU1483497.1 response regulator [Bacteroidota bacterium]MBU2267827.1 response regulator [Bacteroidota bacterium]MBU2376739.1 response regulator [Bacteroidota bacterium]
MQKILIIDDEIGICLIMSKFLTKNGYQTTIAESGETAFGFLSKETFDLVLSDFRLEDTDGREILKKIKKEYPKTSVIIVSGFGDPNLAAELISLGAYDFINKPIYPNVILETVKNALDDQQKSFA